MTPDAEIVAIGVAAAEERDPRRAHRRIQSRLDWLRLRRPVPRDAYRMAWAAYRSECERRAASAPGDLFSFTSIHSKEAAR